MPARHNEARPSGVVRETETKRSNVRMPSVKRTTAAAAVLDGPETHDALQEAHANTRAVFEVMDAVSRAATVADAVRATLDAVRQSFEWEYGSYWELDNAQSVLRFSVESGAVNEEFRRVTMSSTFSEGVGLSGRAWRARDLYFVPDLAEMKDCVRAPVALRAGVKSGVCFPILLAGQVAGTMDFFSLQRLSLSEERLEALRNVGLLVSSSITRFAETEREKESAANTAAINRLLDAFSSLTNTKEAIGVILETVRQAFGWAYGSYWQVDPDRNRLVFYAESGTVSDEFRRVTAQASFGEGEGLCGRAWKNRDLVFVPDLGELKDCVRAPVAQRSGVKSGICFPVMVKGNVIGRSEEHTSE